MFRENKIKFLTIILTSSKTNKRQKKKNNKKGTNKKKKRKLQAPSLKQQATLVNGSGIMKDEYRQVYHGDNTRKKNRGRDGIAASYS